MLLSAADPPLEFTTDQCHTLPLDCPISLYISSNGETISTVNAQHLTLIKKNDGTLKDCHLIVSVSFDQYQYILDHGLFHLKPEVRGPLHQVDFLPELPILLELGLQPQIFKEHSGNDQSEEITSATEQANALLSDLLTLLENGQVTENLDDALAPQTLNPKTSQFIQDLVATPETTSPSPAPWQTTDGWLGRSVQQRQNNETVGYATLWAYTTPEQTEPVFESGQTALEAISTLLQSTSDAFQSEIEQHLPQVKQSLSVFSDELISALEQVDWETLLVTEEDDQSEQPDGRKDYHPISDVVRQFFDDDDWSYISLDNLAEEPTPGPSQEGMLLQMAFEGDAGRWTCLAQTDNEAQQVVFYSLCPISVPEERYGQIAELILRVNDGLIIGNFEFDLTQGDIRYKTSLDTEGDRLTPALMRRLVYANVETMDIYLPTIVAVLSGDCSPIDAIANIERERV